MVSLSTIEKLSAPGRRSGSARRIAGHVREPSHVFNESTALEPTLVRHGVGRDASRAAVYRFGRGGARFARGDVDSGSRATSRRGSNARLVSSRKGNGGDLAKLPALCSASGSGGPGSGRTAGHQRAQARAPRSDTRATSSKACADLRHPDFWRRRAALPHTHRLNARIIRLCLPALPLTALHQRNSRRSAQRAMAFSHEPVHPEVVGAARRRVIAARAARVLPSSAGRDDPGVRQPVDAVYLLADGRRVCRQNVRARNVRKCAT